MTESLNMFYIFSNISPFFAYIGPGMGGGIIAATAKKISSRAKKAPGKWLTVCFFYLF